MSFLWCLFMESTEVFAVPTGLSVKDHGKCLWGGRSESWRVTPKFLRQSKPINNNTMNTNVVRRSMNRNFKVKINRGSLSVLVGWEGLVSHVGRTRAFLLVSEALSNPMDKWSRKYRSGLRVTFYSK